MTTAYMCAHPHTCHITANKAWYCWHVQLFVCSFIHLFIHSFSVSSTHTHTHQVKEVYVKENDSIGEDEVILEFYPEEQD